MDFMLGFLLGFALCIFSVMVACFCFLRKFASRHNSWLRSKNEGW